METDQSLTSPPCDPNRDLSIVVPLFNEEESLPELMAWIARRFWLDRDLRGGVRGRRVNGRLVDGGPRTSSRPMESGLRGMSFAQESGKKCGFAFGLSSGQGESGDHHGR